VFYFLEKSPILKLELGFSYEDRTVYLREAPSSVSKFSAVYS
jgi:hypothetical protein